MAWQPPLPNPGFSPPKYPAKPTPPPKKKKPKGGTGINLGKPGAYQGPTTKGSAQEQYIKWAKKRGVNGKTAQDIWFYAGRYASNSVGSRQAFSYYWTAVLLAESGASHLDSKGNIKSSGQAEGIGQIAFSWVGQQVPWLPKGILFTNDGNGQTGLKNYAVNLRFSGYLLASAVSQYGYQGAYTKGYNSKDPNRFIAWNNIQSTLGTVKGVPFAPSQGQGSAPSPGAPPTQVAGDPWVVGINAKGGLILNYNTIPPKHAISYDGLPLTRSTFLSLRRSLEPYYISYTGARPSPKQVLAFVKNGWSTYKLTTVLAQSPNFTKSPIWKSQAPAYQAAARDLTPTGSKVPTELIRTAILNNWSQTAFEEKLRELPGYIASNDFKSNTATLLNVHSSIMGPPDAKAMKAIQQATLAGWKPDQYAAWLRGQPQYVESPEYQTKTLSFLGALGLITGQQPVLKKGVESPKNNPNLPVSGGIPKDKRLPAGRIANPEDTIATYG